MMRKKKGSFVSAERVGKWPGVMFKEECSNEMRSFVSEEGEWVKQDKSCLQLRVFDIERWELVRTRLG